MASQPVNSDILVFRNVRAFRQAHRHESVAALIKRLRPLVMSIPAELDLVGVQTRDANVSDMSPYMGQARYGGGRGFPIVVGLNTQTSFAQAQSEITGVDFGFQIGHDMFLDHKSDEVEARDLHQDLRDVPADM